MVNLSIGPEQEFNLYHSNFTIANLAEMVLDHPANIKSNGDPIFVKEGTNAQIEHNWLPSTSIDNLCIQFLDADKALGEMLRSSLETSSVHVIPISENGAGLAKISSRVSHRTPIYDAIFGDVEHLTRISGIHNHIDVCPDFAVEQYNALVAMVPGISLTSNSPIDYKGINGHNCTRYNFFANPDTGYFKRIPERLEYIKSMEDIIKRDKIRFEKWRQAYLEAVGNTTIFDKYFTVENTGYPEIRFRPDIGINGTFEMRKDDSTTIDIHLGNSAFILGTCNRICNGVNIEYANVDGDYYFNENGDGKIVLPTRNYLIYTLITEGMKDGLKNSAVNHYLTKFLNFAMEGLPDKEKHYLNPLYAMLYDEKNLSSQVLDFLDIKGHKQNENKQYSFEATKEANWFVWKKQREAINGFRAIHHQY